MILCQDFFYILGGFCFYQVWGTSEPLNDPGSLLFGHPLCSHPVHALIHKVGTQGSFF
jgi:hypothetical protein